MTSKHTISLLLMIGLVLLTGCQSETGTGTASPLAPAETITSTSPATAAHNLATATADTANIEPLAARVNGEAISLAEYQAELQRLQAAEPGPLTYSESAVLEELINQVLLAQGAAQAGFQVDETLLETRIAQLGLADQELNEWMAANFYDPTSFRQALTRAIAAAWMRDQISAQVPSTTEQIHARQILLYNADEANAVYAQLEAGTNFVTIAEQYDPITLGELGWFPRGYLTVPELDEVIFDLPATEYSPVIESALGFHIVQVIEKDPQRELAQDARLVLQQQAVQAWLAAQEEQSEIERFVP